MATRLLEESATPPLERRGANGESGVVSWSKYLIQHHEKPIRINEILFTKGKENLGTNFNRVIKCTCTDNYE